jgi:hypothetical protein
MLKKLFGLTLLLVFVPAAFSMCIEMESYYKTKEFCDNFQCCGWADLGYGSFCIKNCSTYWQTEKTDWIECLDECEPGTCTQWNTVPSHGEKDCDLDVCVEWSPETTECVTPGCASYTKIDIVYSLCSDPDCEKCQKPHVGRRQFPEAPEFNLPALARRLT